MAQLIVRRLDDDVKERLKARAEAQWPQPGGRGASDTEGGGRGGTHAKKVADARALAVALHARFKGIGFTKEELAAV